MEDVQDVGWYDDHFHLCRCIKGEVQVLQQVRGEPGIIFLIRFKRKVINQDPVLVKVSTRPSLNGVPQFAGSPVQDLVQGCEFVLESVVKVFSRNEVVPLNIKGQFDCFILFGLQQLRRACATCVQRYGRI